MNLLIPLIYLRLRDGTGNLVIRRDLFAWAIVSALLAVPCIAFQQVNYFHNGGLLDKIGTFSSVLIGFYVAALIGVATLNSTFADLDQKITIGIVRKPSSKDGAVGDDLTRREYICFMFGYMAFIALVLALASLIVIAIVPSVTPFTFNAVILKTTISLDQSPFRAAGICLFSITLASLALTTVRGLYYLMDRIYYEAPKVDQSRNLNDPSGASPSGD